MICVGKGRTGRSVAIAAALMGVLSYGPAEAQDPPPAAWRVECTGDGKTLECRAVQSLVNRDDNKQLVALLTVRTPSDTKTPVMMLQLPLGLNLAEPVQIKVDNGPVEKQQVQTCTNNNGCFVGLQLNDKMVAALRGGTLLHVAMQDSNKRSINLDVPLLGFGLALDKTK
jgi:invasion protein IalB